MKRHREQTCNFKITGLQPIEFISHILYNQLTQHKQYKNHTNHSEQKQKFNTMGMKLTRKIKAQRDKMRSETRICDSTLCKCLRLQTNM